MQLNRLQFIYSLLASPGALAASMSNSTSRLPAAISGQLRQEPAPQNHGRPRISPMLYGPVRVDTDLDAWLQSISAWGVEKWMAYAFPYHPRYDPGAPRVHAFVGNLSPEFSPYLDPKALHDQEQLLLKQANLSSKYGLEFWYLLPFPIFPTTDREAVEKAAPYLFSSGGLNLFSPRLADLLKTQIRAVKQAMPSLKGVNLWFAEGAGGMISFSRQDLAQSERWQTPIIEAFNEVLHDLKMEGIVFAHNYLLTVGMHREIYKMMASFPDLDIMEDITWPEEDMQHPFLGYLPPRDRELLFEVNPVDLNFLLDTEYIGQGVLPSVYPRWWKHNVGEAVRCGSKIAMGRTFMWDGGYTDVNFNRLNCYIFARLCYEPELDPRQLLEEAATQVFGKGIDRQLIDILWETEPVLKKIVGVNGIASLDHSSFPMAEDIDVLYMNASSPMHGIDDLFQPPGTILYPPLTDDLTNFKQWRWQDRTLSEPAQVYIAEKKAAIEWTNNVLPEVTQLASSLSAAHRELFVHGYRLMGVLAQGMELFVEAAALHYQWAHAKTMDDSDARVKFGKLAASFRSLARTAPANPFSYSERMIHFADFLEQKLPRLSTKGKAAS